MGEGVETFIRDLYCQSGKIKPEAFRHWALLQLTEIMNFDAALWGTGHIDATDFHYVEHLGLDEFYGQRLAETLEQNPIREVVLNNLGLPVSMSEHFPDDHFFSSPIYERLFKPYGIKRILATGHIEPHSKLCTLVSLYRFDKDNDFRSEEKTIIARIVFHLAAAASHNYFEHLNRTNDQVVAAICDRHGYFYEVQPDFFNVMERAGISPKEYRFNDTLSPGEFYYKQGLVLNIVQIGALYKLEFRQSSPFDLLTDRERQIVAWVSKGLTFKEVARELGVAPSTISNHLYRIYKKLDITSRSELARLHSTATENVGQN